MVLYDFILKLPSWIQHFPVKTIFTSRKTALYIIMNKIIISRFRSSYWIRKFIEYCGGIVIVSVCLAFSIDGGNLDYRNALFWIGCFGIIAFVVHFFHFLFWELKILTISDKAINVEYLLTRKIEEVTFKDIKKLSERRIRHKRGVGLSDGYYEFKIEFANGKILVFDQDQYDNYAKLKMRIYEGKKLSLATSLTP